MAMRSLLLIAHLLSLVGLGAAVSVTTDQQERSYVEIGAHGLDLQSEKQGTHKKRLIREEAGSAANIDGEALPESSLLEVSGPGLLQESDDKFTASVIAMHNLSKGMHYDCSAQYGEEMLAKMMREYSVRELCEGNESTITCHERYPFDDSAKTQRFMCEMKRVMLSKGGTTVSQCMKSPEYESFFEKQGVVEHHIFGKFTEFGSVRNIDGTLECKHHKQGRAIVQIPSDATNFYEWYGDWVTLWETMAAMKWNPKDTDLYLIDKVGMVKETKRFNDDNKVEYKYLRPFDEAWERAFSKDNLHIGDYESLFHEGVCFDHLVTVPHGQTSTLTFRGGRGGSVGCPSPLIMASAQYLQSLFPPTAEDKKRDLLARPPDGVKTKQLTLMLRRGRRAFPHDSQAIRAIKEVLPADWSLVTFRPEDNADFSTSLNTIANTQLFVGVHGAGMTHIMFLPPKARIVEVFCDGKDHHQRHFRNIEVMANPTVGPHLFSYYFESDAQECKINQKVLLKAIKAYEDDVASPVVKAATSAPNELLKMATTVPTSPPTGHPWSWPFGS